MDRTGVTRFSDRPTSLRMLMFAGDSLMSFIPCSCSAKWYRCDWPFGDTSLDMPRFKALDAILNDQDTHGMDGISKIQVTVIFRITGRDAVGSSGRTLSIGVGFKSWDLQLPSGNLTNSY